jgi:hypothetical protein
MCFWCRAILFRYHIQLWIASAFFFCKERNPTSVYYISLTYEYNWKAAYGLLRSGTSVLYISNSVFGELENSTYNKKTRCTNFSNLFWNETLHVSDSSSVHHQGSFTVHSAMLYVMQVCRQLSRSSRMYEFYLDLVRKLSTNLYDINHCWVYSE